MAAMYSVQRQRRQGGQRTLTFIAGAGVTALCLSLGSPLSPPALAKSNANNNIIRHFTVIIVIHSDPLRVRCPEQAMNGAITHREMC